jgi:acyl dehydratase
VAICTDSAVIVEIGMPIPSWTMDRVDPERMKTMAAILRDPYPVHWDRTANARLGLEGRVINQGPLNLSYIANMLMEWAGPSCVRRLTVSFGPPVLDGDTVTACGSVIGLDVNEGERRAVCDVWLERDGERVVSGTAVVAVPD